MNAHKNVKIKIEFMQHRYHTKILHNNARTSQNAKYRIISKNILSNILIYIK